MFDIVIFATREWDVYQRRPHYQALSKYARVLVVELPVTPILLLTDPKRFFRKIFLEKSTRKINDNLIVTTPFTIMPYALSYRYKWTSKINSIFFSIWVKKILKDLNFIKWGQILFLPHQSGLEKILNPVFRCYEIVDEYTTLDSPDTDLSKKHDQRMISLEKEIMGQVDVSIATSEALYKKKMSISTNIELVLNSTDTSYFSLSCEEKFPIPIELELVNTPILGFVGHLTDFVDYDLMLNMALYKPDWSIVLMGEYSVTKNFDNQSNLNRFLKLPNVYYIGRKPYEELPNYIKYFSVSLMPYLLSDRLKYSHPNKIYMYLACGKPIVSTPFESALSLKEFISCAHDSESWIKLIEHELLNDSDKKKHNRQEYAAMNSLDERAKQKMRIFNKIVKSK